MVADPGCFTRGETDPNIAYLRLALRVSFFHHFFFHHRLRGPTLLHYTDNVI